MIKDAYDLDGLVALAAEHAEKMLIRERVKQLTPMYMLLHDEEDDTLGIDVIACEWGSDMEKDLAVLAVKKRARQVGAVAFSFVTEAWQATRPASNPNWKTPPSQDPQRREIVFVYATDGRRRLVRRWQIVRNKPGGRIISLIEEKAVTEADEFAGRMVDGILP